MISAIGSDVATWHPPPPSYEMARPDTRSRVGLTQSPPQGVDGAAARSPLRCEGAPASLGHGEDRSGRVRRGPLLLRASRDIPAHSPRPESSLSAREAHTALTPKR